MPNLGICLGMQIAAIEIARNKCGLEGANSTEFDPDTPHPVIALMTEWQDRDGVRRTIGGTSRRASRRQPIIPQPGKGAYGTLANAEPAGDVAQPMEPSASHTTRTSLEELGEMGRKRNLTTPIADTQTATPTQDAGGFHAVTDWVMAVLLLGAAGLAVWYFKISWNFDFDSRDFNPIVFVPVFLGAYGFYHFILALRATLRGRKFGSSTLHVREAVVRMGGPLNGVIRTAVELHPTSDYEIRLQCIETFAMPRGSGETSRNVDRIRWESSTKVGCGSVNSKDGIPFAFTLPSPFEKTAFSEPGSMVSAVAAIGIPGLHGVFAHNRSPDATRWIVTIDAPLQGLDYHAFFGVIVKDSTREGSTEIVLEL